MKPKLRIFDDLETLSIHAANLFSTQAARSILERGSTTVPAPDRNYCQGQMEERSVHRPRIHEL